MNIAVAKRASVVLYNYLKSNCRDSVFAIPSNVCPIVPLTFITAGVKYYFVDISPVTHAIDKDMVTTLLINGKIDSLLYVHAYGCQIDNSEYFKNLKSCGCKFIIEDKCLCIPSLPSEVDDGLTDLFLFSTGYAKYVEFGEGGYGVFKGEYNEHIPSCYYYSKQDDDNIFEKIRIALLNNSRFKYAPCNWLDFSVFSMEGYFEKIEIERVRVVQHKRLINAIYNQMIPEEIQMGQDFINWRYMILSDHREQCLHNLFDAGFFGGKNYPSVSYLYDAIHSPNAESEGTKTLNLFNDFRIDEPTAISIAEVIRKI